MYLEEKQRRRKTALHHLIYEAGAHHGHSVKHPSHFQLPTLSAVVVLSAYGQYNCEINDFALGFNQYKHSNNHSHLLMRNAQWAFLCYDTMQISSGSPLISLGTHIYIWFPIQEDGEPAAPTILLNCHSYSSLVPT